jgi:ABC-type cobalt transport system, ATPase component
MAKTIVSVEDLTYYYPKAETPALININMSISEGEFVVIAGPSGGGKSTLCRILTGLIPHSYGGELRGSVYINGINVTEKGPRSIVGIVGAVFQVPENQIVNLVVEEE